MMDDKALSLLGLMRRAAAVQLGEDKALATVNAGQAKLLLLAADISENALRHAERVTEGRRVVKLPVHYTREELGKAVGLASCAMAAITDIGFADAFLGELKKQSPEEYGSTAELIRQRRLKAQRRKKETGLRKTKKSTDKRRTDA